MCARCLGKEFEGEQFHATKNSSMGDDGIAIKNSTKYDGTGDQDEKFEGQHPGKSSGAKEVEYTGRQ
jgi:hypothetical protein